MRATSVTLRSVRDSGGSRLLTASLSPDGTLTIEGHDYGDGVENFFGPGNREYEWVWTISPDQACRLAAALDAGDDLLGALKRRFSDAAASRLHEFLEACGVRYQAWSRVGE